MTAPAKLTAASCLLVLALVGLCEARTRYQPSRDPSTWYQAARPTPADVITNGHEIRVELVARNLEKLTAINEAVSDPRNARFGQYLTTGEVKALVGRSEEEVKAVQAWLEVSHCSSICELKTTVGVHADHVFASTCPARVECQFRVSLAEYRLPYEVNARVLRAETPSDPRDVAVPAELRSVVSRVMGVVDLPVVLKRQGSEQVGNPYAGVKITPLVIRKNYQQDQYADIVSTSPQTSQACGEFQHDFWRPNDLTSFQAYFDLPENNVTNIIGEDDWEELESMLAEASLDFQYISTVSNLETWAFVQGGFGFDLIAYCETVLATPGAPLVHSLSYGATEVSYSDDDLGQTNTEFLKMTTQGFTILAASGDSGTASTKGFSCPAFAPLFPATSPYVTAVGAVYLESYNTTDQCTISFSGSGFSNYFTRQSYQDDAVNGYFNSGVALPDSFLFNATGQGIPDLAAYGTNFEVNIKGRKTLVAGTSASCPVVAAMVAYGNALRAQNGDPSLGNINPRIYQAGSSKIGTDITCGESKARQCDQGFYATTGWDPATGLGTPLASLFYTLLTE